VVHGIGTQTQAEVAAVLRSGFDDAWDAINRASPGQSRPLLPPPYVHDGWWADYADVKKTFQEHYDKFEDEQKTFFEKLWKQRTTNALGTVFWFLKQQLRLLHWRTLAEMGPVAYVLYVFLQIVAPFILLVLYFRAPELVRGFLTDVRMYAEPRGVTERAIIQRIDARVGDLFLKMIGLDREFRRLDDEDCVKASGEPLRFERVIWVAHSLGTVISYNVLSDLFQRAAELERTGDAGQKEGVRQFRRKLRRFVTLGSPLDKFAFLFETALRPWPAVPRRELLTGGETFPDRDDPEWWINYFHVLDPVSGALNHKATTAGQPAPLNLHLRNLFRIPGAAHVDYWRDVDVLRYILGRTYGVEHLPDPQPVRERPVKNRLYGLAGIAIWTVIVIGAAWAIVFKAVPYLWGKAAAFFA
jgi:hypothetical protein